MAIKLDKTGKTYRITQCFRDLVRGVSIEECAERWDLTVDEVTALYEAWQASLKKSDGEE